MGTNGEEGVAPCLFLQILMLNAAVLVVATVMLMLGPVTVSTPVLPTEALSLTTGLIDRLGAERATRQRPRALPTSSASASIVETTRGNMLQSLAGTTPGIYSLLDPHQPNRTITP